MFVPLTHGGDKGWIFNLVCPGNAMSVSFERLLLLKSATVNWNLGFDEVCKDKHVYAAYQELKDIFEVDDEGEMVKIQYPHYVGYWNIAMEWEIQAAFFKSNSITPHWINANYTWGSLNETTGQWSGGVGLIQRDEADYTLWSYSYTHARSKVVSFSPAMNHQPMYWLSRYPNELAPTWNLLGLFTKGYDLKLAFQRKPSLTLKIKLCSNIRDSFLNAYSNV